MKDVAPSDAWHFSACLARPRARLGASLTVLWRVVPDDSTPER